MNIKDYEFYVEDEVITTEGIRGKITSICTCDRCQERGFYELFWKDENEKYGYEHCISIYDAKSGFSSFYKIGKYRFSEFDKGEVLREMANYEDRLKQLRKQLKLIEELENN